MKKALALTAALVAGSFYLSCEKDDICAEDTPTTPSLVVEFYNKDNTTIQQSVTNLQVTAVGEDTPLPLNGTALFATVNRVTLPLRTNEDITQYLLTFNSQDPAADNTDIITINYNRTETYVSRACGYKTTFTLIPFTALPEILSPGTDGTAWINNIGIENTSIENENDVHVKIYF